VNGEIIKMLREAVVVSFHEGLKNTTTGFSKYTRPPNGKLSMELGEHKAGELITPPRHLLFGRENK
jgi:hypothetical protein